MKSGDVVVVKVVIVMNGEENEMVMVNKQDCHQ